MAEQYLHMAGFEAVDPRIVRIISVTAQKFISDIANDALQHCKTRSNSQHSGSHGSNKVIILEILFKCTINYNFGFRTKNRIKIANILSP